MASDIHCKYSGIDPRSQNDPERNTMGNPLAFEPKCALLHEIVNGNENRYSVYLALDRRQGSHIENISKVVSRFQLRCMPSSEIESIRFSSCPGPGSGASRTGS